MDNQYNGHGHDMVGGGGAKGTVAHLLLPSLPHPRRFKVRCITLKVRLHTVDYWKIVKQIFGAPSPPRLRLFPFLDGKPARPILHFHLNPLSLSSRFICCSLKITITMNCLQNCLKYFCPNVRNYFANILMVLTNFTGIAVFLKLHNRNVLPISR